MRKADEFDSGRLAQGMGELGERSQRVVQAFLEGQSRGDGFSVPDPRVVAGAFTKLTQAMLADPGRLIEAQARWWQQMGELWQTQMRKALGEPVAPVAAPDPADKRFKDEAWNEALVFDYVKQSYLVSARWIQDTVAEVEGLDPKTREKVAFYTRNFVDALAPSNFPHLNPTVLRHASETKGESLLNGLKNLLADLERGKGQLKISMTKEEAFAVGENIAITPGKVIHQNELMQLIQYTATTAQVHQRPLLIVPPWINKFYILDLKPKNSFIKWAVDQGFTLFVISWVNPGERLGGKTFEDYMTEGPLAALDAIEQQTGEREATIIGYCLGGTLTACLLSYLAAKEDDRVKAATFFTCMTDFSEPGELAVFIDEEQLQLIERHMQEKGYLEARHMQQVFNLMRANDLIWGFVVNNPARPRADGVRPALLERRQHPHALHDAQLLSQELLPEEPAGQAGRDRARRRADRSRPDRHSLLLSLDQRGSHRALARDLQGQPELAGPRPLRARRLGPHRGGDQSPALDQVRLLDQRRAAADAGSLARDGDQARGLVVAGLAGLARREERAAGAGARPGGEPAEADRGRAGQLRQGARPGVAPPAAIVSARHQA